MTNEEKYKQALFQIATGRIKDEPDNHADTLQICRDIAVEALGEEWKIYEAAKKSA